jgi:hypothetical protein
MSNLHHYYVDVTVKHRYTRVVAAESVDEARRKIEETETYNISNHAAYRDSTHAIENVQMMQED